MFINHTCNVQQQAQRLAWIIGCRLSFAGDPKRSLDPAGPRDQARPGNDTGPLPATLPEMGEHYDVVMATVSLRGCHGNHSNSMWLPWKP